MSPKRVAHARIKSRVWAALDRAIRAGGLDCEALPDGITVEVDADTDFEPDAVVNCGPRLPPDAVAAARPVIVVEVLSPATQALDVGDKLAEYFRVPSIMHYLVVRVRRREVIHHRRAGAEIVTLVVTAGEIRLDPPGIGVRIEDFYPDAD
ncbi:MAG: Uma2 family endonuclease [Rhodospirillales bacterium]|nr:Uma2 family endonuclease [Rhodospirillales bacterium]